jgi:RNA polymerase sigma-70 factor (ECF subfamily)
VERALKGFEDGFRTLVARYQRPVYNLLARMLRDPALAEDLTQETLLKAYGHLSSFDARFKFSSWIFRIAHNTAVDALRRRPRRETSLDDPGPRERARVDQALVDPRSDAGLRSAERRDLARVLEAALDRLRPEYRQVVVLRYHEDLSYEEVAGITSLPLGTVKSYLHRARAEMAEFLVARGWNAR